MWANEVFGGVLNIMRQCRLVRSLGAEAVLATETGTDTYGRFGIGSLEYVAWSRRRPDDFCVIPDLYSSLANDVRGRVAVFLQHPLLVRANIDNLRPEVQLWVCSPLMAQRSRTILGGVEPTFVPPIVDPAVFPYIDQQQRRRGQLMASPRKNARDFIRATYDRYRHEGGRYWELDPVERLPFCEYAEFCRTPQALLPATDVEGLALPPLEAMAAGIVVSGKNAGGASFYMRDRETALVANSVGEAAAALREIEAPDLRQRLSETAYASVREFFPDAAPRRFWEGFLGSE